MRPHPTSVQPPLSLVETIVAAYLDASGGDSSSAMHRLVEDALTDLCEAERRTQRRDRLISRGYVRGVLNEGEIRAGRCAD